MIIDLLKHTIVNACKSVTFGMKQPDVKFFRFYLESVLEYRTTVLSRLGDTKKMDAKHILKYFSRNLGKEVFGNLPSKVQKVLSKLVGSLPPDACFCFDSVDLNKYSARKMEAISLVRDGSTGDIVNGYVINAVSVKGIPIIMEREILEKGDAGKTTRFDIFSKHVGIILSHFGSGYWILCDRLYDDVNKFNLLIEQGLRFAMRMKTARYLTILEGNSEWLGRKVKVGDILEGHYLVTFKKLSKPCYLTVKCLPGYSTPIRVLSNESNPDIVVRYLKRWEIERVFKSCKQEFDFEKIGTKSIQKIDNLIAIVQLCLGISVYVYGEIESEIPDTEAFRNSAIRETKRKTTVSTVVFRENMKKYLKQASLKFNRNSIIGFIGEYMKKVRKMKWNLRVTIKPSNTAQLRLELGC